MSVPDGLLVLLSQGPRHGYQLATEFAQSTAGRWSINTGQVYTTLERLVRDGFAELDGIDPDDPRRRIYRLTPSGTARAETWLFASPAVTAEPRSDLLLQILLAVATRHDQALQLIDGQRRQLMEVLQERRKAQRNAPETLLDQIATDAAASRIEADLAWLDRCEARLRAIATQPDKEQSS